MFASTMDMCQLIDLGFNGPKFTWTNKRKSKSILKRLDRGWADSEWIQSFPNANLWYLPRITSDHCPILLKLHNDPFIQGEKPFRFEPIFFQKTWDVEMMCVKTSKNGLGTVEFRRTFARP